MFSTFLLPGQPCMSWLDMHPQVQRAKFCNKFSRFSPSSAFGRASIALRRPAKATPVSCWSKLAANVSSRCFQRCWFACGKDNTNASYSGMTALHPGPRRCAPRAGIRRSCPHTRVVLSTYFQVDCFLCTLHVHNPRRACKMRAAIFLRLQWNIQLPARLG